MNTNTSKKTFLLVEGALMIAMAFVLSYIKLYDMPMGGSITLEMIPLVIMGLRHGVKWGTFTAAVHGIIQLILGFSNVMVLCYDSGDDWMCTVRLSFCLYGTWTGRAFSSAI